MPPTPEQVVIGILAVLAGCLAVTTSVFAGRQAGNWLYYVNADAAGHLFFTNDANAFAAAAAVCHTQNWGCG